MFIGVAIQISGRDSDSSPITGFTEKLLGKIPDFCFAHNPLLVPSGAEKQLGKSYGSNPKAFIRYTGDGRVFSNVHVEHLELGIVPKPIPDCRCRNCLRDLEYSNNVQHRQDQRDMRKDTSPLMRDLEANTYNTCPKDSLLSTPVRLEGVDDYSKISSVTLVSDGTVEIVVKQGMFEARGRWLVVRVGKTNYCQDGQVRAVNDDDREFRIIRSRQDWFRAWSVCGYS